MAPGAPGEGPVHSLQQAPASLRYAVRPVRALGTPRGTRARRYVGLEARGAWSSARGARARAQA